MACACRLRGKSLTGRALSRYFVHEGLKSYTHVSDQHSTFGTQIIVSTERDATFTLDVDMAAGTRDHDVLVTTPRPRQECPGPPQLSFRGDAGSDGLCGSGGRALGRSTTRS